MAVMLLSALVCQPPAPAVDVSVVYEPSQLVVTARARDRRRVKTIVVQPVPKRVAAGDEDFGSNEVIVPKPLAARAQETVSNRGLRATFGLPSRAFWLVVTLNDGSVHRVDREGWTESRIVTPAKITPKAGADTVAQF